MKRHKDLEFAVDDASGRQRIFHSFNEAAGFAVVISIATGGSSQIDVLIHSRSGARVWGGEEAVEDYNDDPDASVHDRVVIRAHSKGRIP